MAVSISFQSIPGAPPYPVSSHPGLWPTDRPHSGRRERTPIPSSSLAAQLNKVTKRNIRLSQNKPIAYCKAFALLQTFAANCEPFCTSCGVLAYSCLSQGKPKNVASSSASHLHIEKGKSRSNSMLCQLSLSDFYDVQKQIRLSSCPCGL